MASVVSFEKEEIENKKIKLGTLIIYYKEVDEKLASKIIKEAKKIIKKYGWIWIKTNRNIKKNKYILKSILEMAKSISIQNKIDINNENERSQINRNIFP